MAVNFMKPGTSIRAAIRFDIQQMHKGMALAHEVIGVRHPQTVKNYTCDTKRGSHTMNLDQFEMLIEWTGGRHTAQAVAEAAGGVFVPTEPLELEDSDLMTELAATLQRFSNLVSTIQAATADNKVSSQEWLEISKAKRQLVEAQHRMVSLVSAMRG